MMKRLCTAFLFILSCSLFASAAEHFAKPGPVELTKDGRRWAQKTLKKMSLEEKVGQMIGIRYYTDFENFDSDAYKQFRDQMQKYHIGTVLLTVHVSGGVLYKNPPLEIAAMANQLQRDSKLPLLVSADFERGLAMRANNVPIFPDAMAFGAAGDPALVQRFGAIVAQESRAVGIQWDFYPIADVNSNPDNPIINIRSYGEDPAEVANMAAAFIHGARANGLLTSVKHFPGHGDTSTDSHLGVARVDGDLARLQMIELPPFKKAIEAGTDSVMIAHVTVPALEPDPKKVASTSTNVIEGVLRRQLGFKGVVVTDAFEMRGLTSLYPPDQNNPAGRAAVDAVKAGEDLILLPSDLDGVFNGIVAAVKSGEIPQARIDEAVERILEMKASVGLNKARLVDLEQVPHLVSRQEDLAFAQQVADAAVTVVRDNGRVMPIPKVPTPVSTEGEIFQSQIKPAVQVVAIIMADSIHTRWERGFEAALKMRRGDATVFYVDNTLALPLSSEILQAVKDAGRVVVAAYVTPVAAKQIRVNGKLVNTVGLPQNTGALLSQILDVAAAKTAVVAMGNPYMAQSFPNVQTYLCTFSAASSSELSAVKVLFGELKPGGKLPVTLPGIAARGSSVSQPRASGKP